MISESINKYRWITLILFFFNLKLLFLKIKTHKYNYLKKLINIINE